ncbi:MAG: sensor histidine kinase, partial [Mangrovibacterium sp.]
ATKDKFISIISHDLRNPVGAFVDVLAQLSEYPEMFPEDTRRQIIRELRDEAEQTYFLLENLLSWARGQKKNIQISPVSYKLTDVVDINIRLLSRLAEQKQIGLKNEVDPDLRVYADQNMISLILRNLLSNAIKFTGKQGKVVVSARNSGKLVEVAVADNGIGIPSENLSSLFAEDKALSTYGTGNEKGSGIGLQLCREFVEAHGGTIGVRSKERQGSIFTFTLPKESSL